MGQIIPLTVTTTTRAPAMIKKKSFRLSSWNIETNKPSAHVVLAEPKWSQCKKQSTGNVWTFQGSTQPPPSSSSSSVLSQAKWVFIPSGQACRLDPRERKSGPVLKSSDGPATKTPRPVPEVKEQPVSKDSLQTIIALLQTHSLLLFMCCDTCIFQLQQDNFISFSQDFPANFLNGSLPVGPWWRLVVASLYIHTRAPRLEDNAEAAPSIPPTSSSLVYASQWLTGSRDQFAF